MGMAVRPYTGVRGLGREGATADLSHPLGMTSANWRIDLSWVVRRGGAVSRPAEVSASHKPCVL